MLTFNKKIISKLKNLDNNNKPLIKCNIYKLCNFHIYCDDSIGKNHQLILKSKSSMNSNGLAKMIKGFQNCE